ncbi:MAG: methionine gamma-lyase family protein [Oscillospiraceae bacterium]|nr:methionine gamma-lyase family protein [Oscillospiraceae bacterium]
MKSWKDYYSIDNRLYSLAEKVQNECQEQFKAAEDIRLHNQVKVMEAFTSCNVSAAHLIGTTGYGYDDSGRNMLDSVFARIVGAQDALVRFNFMSGTHTISTALSALLRPLDKMVSLTGSPYDTLHPVIGINGKKGDGSLIDFGVIYSEVELKDDGLPDIEAIESACKEDIKIAYIQRSRGYSLRPSYTTQQTREIIEAVRKVNKSALIVVDNCYCEFVDTKEPTDYGADLIIGSLIKNAGGGIARTGGYIAGRRDLVEKCADRLCYVGVGKEMGCTLDMNRELFLGLFLAPQTVCNAVKTAIFAARFFESLGFKTTPSSSEKRSDIVQCLLLGNKDRLCSFCRGIQSGAPIDSFVSPEPWAMPGYENEVIMAAGTFTMGASIELSADAPLREPYAAWMQGALSFDSGMLGILLAAQKMLERGEISL